MLAATTVTLVLAALAAAQSPEASAPIIVSPTRQVSVEAISIPGLVSFQGRLLDSMGMPVPDTVYSVRFRLYPQASGGTHYWEETRQVRTGEGLFAVQLGSVTPIPYVPGNGELHLGMRVGSDPEMEPRIRIVSSAYAFLSRRADTADYAASARPSGTAGGDLAGSFPDPVVDGLQGRAVAATAPGAGQVLKWTGSQWAPQDDSTGGGDDVWVRGGDSVLYTVHHLGIARGGSGNAMYGNRVCTHVNLGAESCTTGAVGEHNSFCTLTGGTENRVEGTGSFIGGGWDNLVTADYSVLAGGRHNRVTGYYCNTVGGGTDNTASGIYSTVAGGEYNAATGDFASVPGGFRCGAEGPVSVAAGYADSACGLASGALSGRRNKAGDVLSDTCAVVCGGRDNQATWRYSSVVGGRGNTAGGYNSFIGGGTDNSVEGNHGTIAGGRDNYALSLGAVAGGVENCVYGQGTVPGGYRDTVMGNNGFAAGWHSKVNSDHSNSAAFTGSHTTASNQIRAQAFSTGSVMFSIDHPQDPLGRILNQYAVGSPEMVLLYRGVAEVSEDGRVEVLLPEYFADVNRNPMVQLTGIGTHEVFVAEEVTGNRFAISGPAGTRVYWTVTGERKDQTAEIARLMTPVEQPKAGDLVGHSLDDDCLAASYDELERLGAASTTSFRTAEGRRQAADGGLAAEK